MWHESLQQGKEAREPQSWSNNLKPVSHEADQTTTQNMQVRARNYLLQHCDYGSSLVTVDGIRIKNIFSDVQIERGQSYIREMIQCVNYYSGKQWTSVSDG